MSDAKTDVEEVELQESNRRILAWIQARREKPESEETREWGGGFRRFVAWAQGVINMANTKVGKSSAGEDERGRELSPENRRALKRLREHMATPLTEEDREYWREFRAFVEAHPFTFRGEEKT